MSCPSMGEEKTRKKLWKKIYWRKVWGKKFFARLHDISYCGENLLKTFMVFRHFSQCISSEMKVIVEVERDTGLLF